MPVYDYRCTGCGREVEVSHGIHDAGPATCERCGAPMRKALSAPAIHFKGSGWAKKDARSATKPAAATSPAAGGSEGPGGSKGADGDAASKGAAEKGGSADSGATGGKSGTGPGAAGTSSGNAD